MYFIVANQRDGIRRNEQPSTQCCPCVGWELSPVSHAFCGVSQPAIKAFMCPPVPFHFHAEKSTILAFAMPMIGSWQAFATSLCCTAPGHDSWGTKTFRPAVTSYGWNSRPVFLVDAVFWRFCRYKWNMASESPSLLRLKTNKFNPLLRVVSQVFSFRPFSPTFQRAPLGKMKKLCHDWKEALVCLTMQYCCLQAAQIH